MSESVLSETRTTIMQQKATKLERIDIDNGADYVYVITKGDKEVSTRYKSGNFFDSYSDYYDVIGM
jgi:DNA polymerase elongation subunit (family B)